MKRIACFLGAKLVIVFQNSKPTLFKAVQGSVRLGLKGKKELYTPGSSYFYSPFTVAVRLRLDVNPGSDLMPTALHALLLMPVSVISSNINRHIGQGVVPQPCCPAWTEWLDEAYNKIKSKTYNVYIAHKSKNDVIGMTRGNWQHCTLQVIEPDRNGNALPRKWLVMLWLLMYTFRQRG